MSDHPDPLPAQLKAERGLPLRGDALASIHKPRSLEEAEEGRQRLAFDELLVLQLALARRTAEREQQVAAALAGAGRADRPLPGRAAVRADRAPGGGDRRDRRRPRPHDADAAPAPGRRRLRQDGRRALRAPAGGRGRPPGRADGADRDARRAALPHDRGDLHGARRQLRARHRLGQVEDRRPGGRRRRHARADPEGLRVPRPGRRRRRRAAPLRRRAALARSSRAAHRTSST